ncbi:hypothetical protein T492DRAFT_898571, partial [Pavlovales sp. CCMP2436]
MPPLVFGHRMLMLLVVLLVLVGGTPRDPIECFTRNDVSDYRGAVSVTVRNATCVRWSGLPVGDALARLEARSGSAFPAGYAPDAPGLGEHNYCRRAGSGTFQCAWCFVERPPSPPSYPPPSPAPA